MVWFDSIYQLQFYNPLPGIPCYCEQLVNPTDLYLQGLISNAATSSATLTLYTYNADGKTQYADDTSHYNWFFGVAPNGQKYFSAQLKSFSTSMCNHSCFIVRAVLTQSGNVLFDKYTERYCNTNCCEIPNGITYEQSDIVLGGGTPITTPYGTGSAPQTPTNSCGLPLISLITYFDCYDNFTGDIYTNPATVYSSSGSTNFAFQKISTFQGRIVPRPANVTRNISYNCRLQESELAPQYYFESFDLMPAWKMQEIQKQLCASTIIVNDYLSKKEYQFAGGAPFEQPSKCFEVFKLKATLQDCTIRQYYGCQSDCAATDSYFIIPEAYQTTTGNFYGEAGQLVASSYNDAGGDDLLTYLRSQPNVTNVEDIDVSSLDCNIHALVKITSTGYVPTSIFFGAPLQRNRLFKLELEDVNSICDFAGIIPCKVPVADTVIVLPVNCNTPVNGTVIITSASVDTLTISGAGNWGLEGTDTAASLYANQITMTIDFKNTVDYVGLSGDVISISGETIGTISGEGRPITSQVLDNSTNGAIPVGNYVTITTDGQIVFDGELTFVATNVLVINYANLVYNIS